MKLLEIVMAEAVARLAHYGQPPTSDGLEYIRHPEAVAAFVDDAYKPAAWLHDVLEDTPITDHQLLAVGFSLETIKIVQILTHDKTVETYAEYINRIDASGNVGAITVKVADLQHNMRPGCPESLRKRYERALPILQRRLKSLLDAVLHT